MVASPEVKRELFGPYRIRQRLGGGGMGEILLVVHGERREPLGETPREAREQQKDSLVVVKRLHSALAAYPEAVELFAAEAAVGRQLAPHPHVVAGYASGELEGWHYLEMEYVPGKDLAAIAATEQRLAPPQVLSIAVDMSAALTHLHAPGQGLVHGDVAPANMLVRDDGCGEAWRLRPRGASWRAASGGSWHPCVHVARAGPRRSDGSAL